MLETFCDPLLYDETPLACCAVPWHFPQRVVTWALLASCGPAGGTYCGTRGIRSLTTLDAFKGQRRTLTESSSTSTPQRCSLEFQLTAAGLSPMPGSYAESTQCNHWLFSEQDIAERRGRRTRSPVRRPTMLRWAQCIPTPGFPPFVLVHSPLSACVYLAAIGGGCTLPWRDKYICHATQTPLASKQAFVQLWCPALLSQAWRVVQWTWQYHLTPLELQVHLLFRALEHCVRDCRVVPDAPACLPAISSRHPRRGRRHVNFTSPRRRDRRYVDAQSTMRGLLCTPV